MTSTVPRSLIPPTAHPSLERALRDKLQRRGAVGGGLGELEPLAVRLGLMQNTLKPRLRDPHLLVVAADHGLAVDGLADLAPRSTARQVELLLDHHLPLPVFADQQGLTLSVIDAGVAEPLPKRDRLLVRKIAHGTRNARVTAAMTLDQAHAAIRAGMEIAEGLHGNVLAVAGLGVGGHESAALVLARLADCPVRDLVLSDPDMNTEHLAHLMVIVQGAQGRHRDVTDPIEVLAAFGGFEIAMMVGALLSAASHRQLLMIDGMAACAALMVAARIAPAVTDYCVFCRSHAHGGLDRALTLFRATALLELGMQSQDGTGTALAWPLVRSAAALLTDVVESDEQPSTRPANLDELVSLTPGLLAVAAADEAAAQQAAIRAALSGVDGLETMEGPPEDDALDAPSSLGAPATQPEVLATLTPPDGELGSRPAQPPAVG